MKSLGELEEEYFQARMALNIVNADYDRVKTKKQRMERICREAKERLDQKKDWQVEDGIMEQLSF